MNSSDFDLDVKLAAEVQKLLFPKSSPLCDWCCMGVKFRMAGGLGGDYFDFISLPDGCQFVMIGDVTGHGLHASVVMSLLYGFIYRASINRCDPLRVAGDVNAFLENFAKRSWELDHYFSTTLFCGMINPRTLEMHYVNAGHVPPMVRRGLEVLELSATAAPLGFFENPDISAGHFQFSRGDRLFLYTDGVVETFNGTGEFFGTGAVKDILLRDGSDHLTFLDHLFVDLDNFSGGGPITDDRTAIVIDLHG